MAKALHRRKIQAQKKKDKPKEEKIKNCINEKQIINTREKMHRRKLQKTTNDEKYSKNREKKTPTTKSTTTIATIRVALHNNVETTLDRDNIGNVY